MSSPTDNLQWAFATPIYLRRGAGSEALNHKLAQTIRELSKKHPSDDAYRAHQGGFYTDGDFLGTELPGVKELKPVIADAVQAFVKGVAPTQPKAPLHIIGWAALTRERDYQTPHLHAGANISGVYYVEVPELPSPQGAIDFLTPIDLKEMTFIQGDAKTYARHEPRAGDLLLFPSYLKHYTHPFFGPGERIAVAFNVSIPRARKR